MNIPTHIKPIMIGAALGALALVSVSSTAHADRCGTPSSYSPQPTYSNSGYNNAGYNNAGYDRTDRRLKKKVRKSTRKIMRRLDYNQDGYISRGEARSSRDLRRKFFRIDRNRDGYIARHELRSHLRRVVERQQRRDRRSRSRRNIARF